MKINFRVVPCPGDGQAQVRDCPQVFDSGPISVRAVIVK